MKDHVGRAPAQETQPFGYAGFICRPCDGQVSMTIEDSLLLASDKSVRCPLCHVAVNVGSYDQQRLRKVHESLSGSGNLIHFATVWFSVTFIVALFISIPLSMLMSSVGVLLSFALNKKVPVIINAIYLEREMGQGVQIVSRRLERQR